MTNERGSLEDDGQGSAPQEQARSAAAGTHAPPIPLPRPLFTCVAVARVANARSDMPASPSRKAAARHSSKAGLGPAASMCWPPGLWYRTRSRLASLAEGMDSSWQTSVCSAEGSVATGPARVSSWVGYTVLVWSDVCKSLLYSTGACKEPGQAGQAAGSSSSSSSSSSSRRSSSRSRSRSRRSRRRRSSTTTTATTKDSGTPPAGKAAASRASPSRRSTPASVACGLWPATKPARREGRRLGNTRLASSCKCGCESTAAVSKTCRRLLMKAGSSFFSGA